MDLSFRDLLFGAMMGLLLAHVGACVSGYIEGTRYARQRRRRRR